jgi:hypothetical protein
LHKAAHNLLLNSVGRRQHRHAISNVLWKKPFGASIQNTLQMRAGTTITLLSLNLIELGKLGTFLSMPSHRL